jgi:hypothetical protein
LHIGLCPVWAGKFSFLLSPLSYTGSGPLRFVFVYSSPVPFEGSTLSPMPPLPELMYPSDQLAHLLSVIITVGICKRIQPPVEHLRPRSGHSRTKVAPLVGPPHLPGGAFCLKLTCLALSSLPHLSLPRPHFGIFGVLSGDMIRCQQHNRGHDSQKDSLIHLLPFQKWLSFPPCAGFI